MQVGAGGADGVPVGIGEWGAQLGQQGRGARWGGAVGADGERRERGRPGPRPTFLSDLPVRLGPEPLLEA